MRKLINAKCKFCKGNAHADSVNEPPSKEKEPQACRQAQQSVFAKDLGQLVSDTVVLTCRAVTLIVA